MDRLIEERHWESYFNFISKLIRGQRLEMEIIGLDIGNQIEETSVSFEGLSYDPEDGTFYIHTHPLLHSVLNPKEIYAIEEGLTVRSICVKDQNNHLQILSFHEPLMLPAPLAENGKELNNNLRSSL